VPADGAATLGDVLYADNSPSIPTERDWVGLVHAVAHGDQVALHALYERAHRPVFTLAMRICRNRESAEELTLDVFHDVWRRARRYDAVNGTVLGWIMNLARSRAIDRVRFDGRKKRVDPFAADADAEVESPDGEQILVARQEADGLRSALAILSADERRVIEAAFFSDLTYAEVAVRFGEPLGTVKTRIRSGLLKLRRALGAEARQA
jgi:RNA polymerase sigma-70 factor (ECF subfamily)